MIHEVETDLEELVAVLKESMPKLREVRLFGSYNNGNWNPETSDIDIGILIDGLNAGEYSIKEIGNKLKGSYRNRFQIFVCTRWGWESNYSTFNAMRSGRLLYRKRFNWDPLTWIKA